MLLVIVTIPTHFVFFISVVSCQREGLHNWHQWIRCWQSANGNYLTQLGPTGWPQSPNLSSSSFNEVINYCDKVSRHQTTICHGINTLMTYVGHTLPEGAGHSKPHTASHTKHILNSWVSRPEKMSQVLSPQWQPSAQSLWLCPCWPQWQRHWIYGTINITPLG